MKALLKIAAVFFAVTLAYTPMHASADVVLKPDPYEPTTEDYKCGDNMVFALDDATQTLTVSGSGDMWNNDKLSILWTKSAYDVRQIVFDGEIESIGKNVFSQCYSLEEIVLPPQIRRIGEGAFRGCVQLHTVTFSEGLTEIGDYAFYNNQINTISLPETVRSIGAHAFENCRELTTVAMHEGITYIGAQCFANCLRLTDIRIPDSVTELGDGVLDGDAMWFRTQTEDFAIFGDGYLYRYFGSDPDVVLPERVKHISAQCFTTPVYKTNIYSPEAGNIQISEYKNRDDITSVTLPDSLTELPEKLFYKMTALQTIRFGKNISCIPYGLCMGCTTLTKPSIPDAVQEIGMYAFRDNAWLEDEDDYVILGDGLLYLYQGNKKVLTLPDGIKTICPNAFGERNIASITMPPSLRCLYENSINGSILTEVCLNDGLTAIPANACILPAGFLQITIPESVTEIDPDAIISGSTLTVCGKTGSAAERYAAEKKLPFLSSDAGASDIDLTPDPEKDCWSFTNSIGVFGAQHYFTDADKAAIEALGFSDSDDWGGSCFGMCVAVILAKNGLFTASRLDPDAADIASLPPSKPVQSFINYYQYTQSSPYFKTYNNTDSLFTRIYKMIRAAQQIPHGASPFLICFKTSSSGGHAVVGCGAETGTWHYMNRDWSCRVTVYDPNTTGFDETRFIYYDPETLAVCIPHYELMYEENSLSAGADFIVCTDPGVLNAYPYPFADSFCKGDLNGDVQVTAADAELLLQHLLTHSELPGNSAQAADLSGDGILNAVDLTLLKRTVLKARE